MPCAATTRRAFGEMIVTGLAAIVIRVGFAAGSVKDERIEDTSSYSVNPILTQSKASWLVYWNDYLSSTR
jgi:hypothetical protein